MIDIFFCYLFTLRYKSIASGLGYFASIELQVEVVNSSGAYWMFFYCLMKFLVCFDEILSLLLLKSAIKIFCLFYCSSLLLLITYSAT